MNTINRHNLLSIPFFALFLMTVSFLPGTAMASLIGDTVTAEVLFGGSPSGQGPADAVVDASIEFDFDNVSIDVYDSGADFFDILDEVVIYDETYRLTGLDWVNEVGRIVGVTIDYFYGLSIAPLAIVTGPHSVDIIIRESTEVYEGAYIYTSFQTVHGVPEPASLALLGLGIAGIGFGRRKQAITRITALPC